MASVAPEPGFVIIQPLAADPFRQLHNEWTEGLCGCTNDMSQCKIIIKMSFNYYKSNAYVCVFQAALRIFVGLVLSTSWPTRLTNLVYRVSVFPIHLPSIV